MNKEYEFLKHFIKEPIYLIDETHDPEDKHPITVEDPETNIDSLDPDTGSQSITHVSEPATKKTTDTGSDDESTSKKEFSIAVLVRYPYVETLPANEKVLLDKIQSCPADNLI